MAVVAAVVATALVCAVVALKRRSRSAARGSQSKPAVTTNPVFANFETPGPHTGCTAGPTVYKPENGGAAPPTVYKQPTPPQCAAAPASAAAPTTFAYDDGDDLNYEVAVAHNPLYDAKKKKKKVVKGRPGAAKASAVVDGGHPADQKRLKQSSPGAASPNDNTYSSSTAMRPGVGTLVDYQIFKSDEKVAYYSEVDTPGKARYSAPPQSESVYAGAVSPLKHDVEGWNEDALQGRYLTARRASGLATGGSGARTPVTPDARLGRPDEGVKLDGSNYVAGPTSGPAAVYDTPHVMQSGAVAGYELASPDGTVGSSA